MPKKSREQIALEEIASDLALHSKCPLRKTATRAVAGEGSGKSGILFIGEAPGKNEDLTGRPFVGAAGKVLDQLLESIGLVRSDVFITSIEKFRPPNNRVPKPKEIMACFPFLERQIGALKPRVIVTLGRYALQRMLSWEAGEDVAVPAMADYHGRIIEGKKGNVYLPLYHPASVLYQRSLFETVKKDFATLNKYLRKR